MSIELLRKQIKELLQEREKATLEKGLAAEDNKDLRENFAYDYWAQKEFALTSKIRKLTAEIDRLAKKTSTQKRKPRRVNTKPVEKIKDLPQNKWL
ncbi:hypothetical protein C4561_00475 [candidate division WWE3 bacterium]|jgi:hypothetical protein|uniref:Transcription elongation factor GreA/GreB N-terminal domain-containing protein n=1 Tax=candidate division WWE3 bacterium TaxID=2053526 RepID=A0A3A4ZG30_UNCKA|nr:MAG: hypothetical protein C4561_00475 [candidate division WWE3 bacterium]